MEISMGGVEKVNYMSVGKTVGIYVEINGERQLFIDKQHLLTKLREGVEARKALMMKHEILYNANEYETGLNIFDGVLALIEKGGE